MRNRRRGGGRLGRRRRRQAGWSTVLLAEGYDHGLEGPARDGLTPGHRADRLVTLTDPGRAAFAQACALAAAVET